MCLHSTTLFGIRCATIRFFQVRLQSADPDQGRYGQHRFPGTLRQEAAPEGLGLDVGDPELGQHSLVREEDRRP